MANFGFAEISLLFKPVVASVPLLKILNVSEPPRMAGVLVSSVFALQTRRYKMYKDVHFVPCLRLICARASYLHRLFSNGLRKIYFQKHLFIRAASENPQRSRTATDDGGSTQQRCFCLSKNSRPEVYTDVHFWTVYFQTAYDKFLFKNTYLSVPLLKILNVS